MSTIPVAAPPVIIGTNSADFGQLTGDSGRLAGLDRPGGQVPIDEDWRAGLYDLPPEADERYRIGGQSLPRSTVYSKVTMPVVAS